jgi:hypothetical protein
LKQLETNSKFILPFALNSFLNKTFFEHLRPQYTSLRYALTIRKNIVIFQISKLKLLHELTDGLTRLRKLPRLLNFFLLWSVMWYSFKMLIYVLGESTPTNSIDNLYASNGNNAKINVTSILKFVRRHITPNFSSLAVHHILLIRYYYSYDIILVLCEFFTTKFCTCACA